MTEAKETHRLVETLFRRRSANIVATLVSVFGPANLQLAEDVTQETLLKALRLWPYRGIPENPSAWLFATARNIAIDHLRRDISFRAKNSELRYELENRLNISSVSENELETHNSDMLRMMFVCAHPAISKNAQAPLILKTVCAFSVTEIARAFLTNNDVIAQRLSRARKSLRDTNPDFKLTRGQRSERLPAVLGALYLLFSEGYSASGADESTRAELCSEAMRLIDTLLDSQSTNTENNGEAGETAALGALCNLQASRLATRIDEHGALIPLEEQDRSQWNRELQAQGFQLLKRSMQSKTLSVYHLQAGIAATHATASSFAEINWKQIVAYYNDLIVLQDSPVFVLNRAVALSFVEGIDAALSELTRLADDPKMKSFYLFHATIADLKRRRKHYAPAKTSYETARTLTNNPAEKRFLMRRIAELS
ncbi:hypothetical protein JYT16_00985 [Gemmatimonas aurantiaca]|nr:hypothetical protein [Gemmatimonas aurantiaca]